MTLDTCPNLRYNLDDPVKLSDGVFHTRLTVGMRRRL